ncbi:glycosyltransferase family 4 protein [Aminivibrio sp.]|uniref:glycosyltransferase family 4 protein n=1 Tax=Aminivibrio sp. TaxID=1872489 RepID=UPI003D97F531
MKILMIGLFPPPIHGVTMANDMFFRGISEKHDIQIIDTKANVTIGDASRQGKLSLKKICRVVFSLLSGVFRLLFSPKFDIAYLIPGLSFNGFIRYSPFIFSAKIRGIPCVIHIHGGSFREMYISSKGWKKKFLNWLLSLINGVIVLGPSFKDTFKNIFRDDQIFICPNGIPNEIIASKEEVKEKESRRNSDVCLNILYLSNLMKRKGILDLLEAVRILKKESVKFHLDIAGFMEPEIKKQIESFLGDLKEEAKYYGVVSGKNKKNLFLKNYVFCLPTYFNEGQPISILEAMANACTIVTTDQGGIKDIVDERYCCFAETQNPLNLVEKLLCAWKKTGGGIIAWEEAVKTYSEVFFIKRIEDIFNTILRQHKLSRQVD